MRVCRLGRRRRVLLFRGCSGGRTVLGGVFLGVRVSIGLFFCRIAVIEAIESVQQNVTESLTENQTYGGASQPGYFYAVVDDGSGNPPSNFLASVFNAVDAVRPIGSVFGIFPPVEVTANIGMTLTTAAGYDHTTLVTAVQNAITAFVNALNVGDDLPYSRLAQIAYTTSPGITNVTGVLLNSGTSDLVTTSQQVIKVGTLTII